MRATFGYVLRFNACGRHDPSLRGVENRLLGMCGDRGRGRGGVTGLEASRAPYSKSHARRLKRREKEQLTAGGLGSLKAALPSIAPPTTRTRTTAATIIGDSSAGELDATVTTTTAAAAMIDASLKPSINKLKCKSKQQPTTDDQLEVPPPPTTRPGQIGECHGVPLMRSQGRRRALKAERFRQPLIRLNPEFAANPFETIRTHARNTLVPHRLTTT